MKYFNIKLGKSAGGTLVYPANYQVEIGNFAKDHLYYDDDKGTTYLLLCIEDVDSSGIARTDVTEISEAEAVALSEQYETRVETILDEAKVRRLELKARIGLALTTAEVDSIDPAKPDSVFGVSEILADRIVKIKEVENKKKIK